MARNEVEIFFDTIRQRHQDEAATLLTQQAEFIRRGDLNSIESVGPSAIEKHQRIRAKDRVVFAVRAAVIADVLLTAYDRDPQRLQQLGVDLGQAGIKELQDIRQQGGDITPALKSRLMKDGQALLSRFLADPAVYDELDKNPDDRNTLIALSHFTPLASDTGEALNQLFTDNI